MQVKHNRGIITLFITQRQGAHALPLTSFPTDNIRRHALHTVFFNCLLGFWILTHNLCSQLLVSHFSFVLSFIEMCCLALVRQSARSTPSAQWTQMFTCQSIMLISVLSQWNWMSDEWIVCCAFSLRTISNTVFHHEHKTADNHHIILNQRLYPGKISNAPLWEVIFMHISLIVKICMTKLYLTRGKKDPEMFSILPQKGKRLIWQLENYFDGQQRGRGRGLNNTSALWRSDRCITDNNFILCNDPITKPTK